MVNFFILDKNITRKQKIKKNIKAEIILRNREQKRVIFTKIASRPILCLNFIPFIKTHSKGVHISLFYDKLVSKIPKYGLRTASCHNLKEILTAKNKLKADFIMISPVFTTKSHQDANTLGIIRLLRLLNNTIKYQNFIALGGMNMKRLKSIKRLDFNNKVKGFGGIRDFLE
jgi:thiamine monophosphate synthase